MIDILKCKICGFEGKNLSTHIKYKHLMSTDEYKKIYNEKIVCLHSDELKLKISNTLKKLNTNDDFKKKNSDRQKMGGSCFTIQYWINRGYTEQNAKQKISERQRSNSRKRSKLVLQEGSQFSIKYWMKRGVSKEDAIEKVRKIQSNLSKRSSKYVGHKRTPEQKKKISDSLKKMILKIGKGVWARHFGYFNGRSKIETEFFNFIKSNIDSSVKANIPIGNYIVDVIKDKKIIEFYGDFWHANPKFFDKNIKLNNHLGYFNLAVDIWKKDKIRINNLICDGYDVMIIWENDWKNSMNECVKKIKDFLYDV